MTQKRFLTATEVFQLFGVDADGLDRLVALGDVTALPDLGTFKYRSEDFAKLVKQGKLVPRTSGELFQVDSKGEMPFLKLKNDDQGLKFGEKVEFLELDEAALNEQAEFENRNSPTPVVGPQSWHEESDDSIEIPPSLMPTSGEIVALTDPKSSGDSTDFDFKVDRGSGTGSDSDSDVRLFENDADVDLDSYSGAASGSDSDVRLVGPVSSPGSSRIQGDKKSSGDSEIRLVSKVKDSSKSDSDVTLLTHVIEPSAHFKAPSGSSPSMMGAAAKAGGSDSDIQLSSTTIPVFEGHEDQIVEKNPETIIDFSDSDSDVLLVGLPPDASPRTPVKKPTGKKRDSDSDVRLSHVSVDQPETSAVSPPDVLDFESKTVTDGNLNFGDSNIRLETAEPIDSDQALDAAATYVEPSDDEMATELHLDASELHANREAVANGHSEHSENTISSEFEMMLDDEGASDASLEATATIEEQTPDESADQGVEEILATPAVDDEMAMATLKDDDEIALETLKTDSDFSLEIQPEASEIAVDTPHSQSVEHAEEVMFAMPADDDESALATLITDSDDSLEIQLEESEIAVDTPSGQSVEHAEEVMLATPADDDESALATLKTDSDFSLEIQPEASFSALDQTFVGAADEETSPSASNESDIAPEHGSDGDHAMLEFSDDSIEVVAEDLVAEEEPVESGLKFEGMDSGVRFESQGDSGIALEGEDSGIKLDGGDSGITLGGTDSGITLETGDSGITLETGDSGITLETDDSGITLETDDSGITLETDDSGITVGSGDSGITLGAADSGIILGGTDSGISLDVEEDPGETFVDGDAAKMARAAYDGSQTDNLELSGDELRSADLVSSPSDGEYTMEMASEDGEEESQRTAGTVAYHGPKKKSGPKALDLSEAFELDEPPQVEDLDISDDLNSASDDSVDDSSVEFAEVDEDAVDVSDDAFSAGEVLAGVEEDEDEDVVSQKADVAATKRKLVASEPGWGLDAIVPIVGASLAMAMTMVALLGGVATMWTGAEAPGPAATVISTLAGFSPW